MGTLGWVGRGLCLACWAGLGFGCAGRAGLGALGWVGRGVWLLRFCVIVAETNVTVCLSTFRHQYASFSIEHHQQED